MSLLLGMVLQACNPSYCVDGMRDCVRRMESPRLALSFLEGEIKASLDNLVRPGLRLKHKKQVMHVAQFCGSYKVRIWFSGSHAV